MLLVTIRIGNIMTNITKIINWLDYIRQDALLSDNSFSMSGGGEKLLHRFALGYLSDVGTTIGTSMKRFQYFNESRLQIPLTN